MNYLNAEIERQAEASVVEVLRAQVAELTRENKNLEINLAQCRVHDPVIDAMVDTLTKSLEKVAGERDTLNAKVIELSDCLTEYRHAKESQEAVAITHEAFLLLGQERDTARTQLREAQDEIAQLRKYTRHNPSCGGGGWQDDGTYCCTCGYSKLIASLDAAASEKESDESNE